jgi:hypothetical protein
MGYRSDVAIAIHKDLQGDFLTFLNTQNSWLKSSETGLTFI